MIDRYKQLNKLVKKNNKLLKQNIILKKSCSFYKSIIIKTKQQNVFPLVLLDNISLKQEKFTKFSLRLLFFFRKLSFFFFLVAYLFWHFIYITSFILVFWFWWLFVK
jgi:hypothetical protein